MSARPAKRADPPPPADWRPLLAARPVRNAAAAVEATADGGVCIGIRKAPSPWQRAPWRWVVPGAANDTRRVTLDPLGRGVWDLCDGRTVEAVIEETARRHGLTFHEARVAVTMLVRELIRRGALAIALPDAPGQKNAR